MFGPVMSRSDCAVTWFVENAVIRHETGSQARIEDRMTAALMRRVRSSVISGLVNRWPWAISAKQTSTSSSAIVSAKLNSQRMPVDFIEQTLEELLFPDDRTGFCSENPFFVFLEIGCDVSFGVLQGLLPDEHRRNAVRVGVGDLDVVTEDLVEADLEEEIPLSWLSWC